MKYYSINYVQVDNSSVYSSSSVMYMLHGVNQRVFTSRTEFIEYNADSVNIKIALKVKLSGWKTYILNYIDWFVVVETILMGLVIIGFGTVINWIYKALKWSIGLLFR